MICFRDMTYCEASRTRCANAGCSRYFGHAEEVAARRWWGSEGAPVAFADLSKRCGRFQPLGRAA